MDYVFASLYINYFTFILIFYIIYLDYLKNNLLALIYWGAITFLITGQAIHISLNLLTNPNSSVEYLFNKINAEGHFYASFLLSLSIVLLFSFRFSVNNRVIKKRNLNISFITKSRSKYTNLMYSGSMISIFLFLIASLISLVGSLNDILEQSRPGGASGATMIIIALSFFVYPIVYDIAIRQKVRVFSIIFLLLYSLVMMQFSRIVLLLHLGIVLLTYFYTCNVKIKENKKILSFSFFIFFIVMFVMGTIKDLNNFNLNFIEMIDFIIEKPEMTLFSLDRNYLISVEGMSGLSGVVSEKLNVSNDFFHIDFGISSLYIFLISLLPGFLRVYFQDAMQFSIQLYGYSGSIIAPLFENLFIHFGYFSPIFFGMFLFIFLYYLNSKIIYYADSAKPMKLITSIIIATYGLMILRGGIGTPMFFLIYELLMFYIFINFHKFFFYLQENKQ